MKVVRDYFVPVYKTKRQKSKNSKLVSHMTTTPQGVILVYYFTLSLIGNLVLMFHPKYTRFPSFSAKFKHFHTGMSFNLFFESLREKQEQINWTFQIACLQMFKCIKKSWKQTKNGIILSKKISDCYEEFT